MSLRDRFFGGQGASVDLSKYAAVEWQVVDGKGRYVRLHDEPMPMRECLTWLIEHGYVREAGADDEGNRILRGWGTTYFMVPWEKSVPR